MAQGEGARLEFGDSSENGRSIPVSEALGLASVAFGLDGAPQDADLGLALVVPNAIHEGEQEGLLRGMRKELRRRRLSNARECLIWRPVAAALHWLERHGGSVSWTEQQAEESVGKLLHLHLAIEGCEATWLDLVPYRGESGRVALLPGRRRPLEGDVCKHPMLEVVERACAASLADAEPDEAVRRRMAWHAAWLSPLLRSVAVGAASVASGSLDPLVPTHGMVRELRQRLQWLHGSGMGTAAASAEPSIQQWISVLAASASHQCAGVVVTGSLANWPIATGLTLGHAALHWMKVSPAIPPLVQAIDGASILAQGAAIYAERRRQGIEAYLDSLPAVELRCMQDGEPAWVNLMDFGQRWAVGGRVTRFQVDKAQFSMSKGQDHLEMTVHRDGYKTCRRVNAAFGFRLGQAMPVKLSIEVDPGQGNPRVELVPDDPRVLRGAALVLDWDTAKDTKKDRDTELRETPRGYPAPLFRHADAERWSSVDFYKEGYESCKGVHGLMWHFLSHPAELVEPDRVRYLVGHIVKERIEREEQEDVIWGAAVSSDGQLLAAVAGQRVLDRLVRQAARRSVDPDDDVAACGLRIMGALCIADSEARAAMLRRLAAPRVVMANAKIRGALLSAAGSCLKDPEELSGLFKFIDAAVAIGPNKTVCWQLAECLRQVCRYRKDALAHVSTARVERWIHWLCMQLKWEPMRDRVRPIHARATEAIVYLLRRRRYDRACVAGGGELYWLVRKGMRDMFRGVSRRATDGVFKALRSMRRVRNYVRWQGYGSVVIESDDES